MKLAYLNFNNTKLGGQEADLSINGKQVAKVTNDNFSISLKILADTEYNVNIRNISGGKYSFSDMVKLGPGETANMVINQYYVSNINVMGINEEGSRFTVDSDGTYRFVITGGAYSITKSAGLSYSGYTTSLMIYVNRDITWDSKGRLIIYNYNIGSPSFQDSIKEAEEMIKNVKLYNSLDLNLTKGDRIIFIAADTRNKFIDNSGTVYISVYKLLK